MITHKRKSDSKLDHHHDIICEPTKHEGKWINLFFFQGNYSAPGLKTFSTEKEALDNQSPSIMAMCAKPSDVCSSYIKDKHGIFVRLNTATHAIAMPA